MGYAYTVDCKFIRVRFVKHPEYGTAGSNGIDFFVPEDVEWETKSLSPGETLLIPSGIKVELPNCFALLAVNKSSMGHKALLIGAALVDSDYRGEIHLSVVNASNSVITIKRGQKLVQFIPLLIPKLNLIPSNENDFSETSRGQGGFGHTGLH